MTIINAVTGAGSDPQLVSIDNAVTEFPQTFSPPTGYDGLSSVTVQAPANFKASNIKKDVEIAGVTGTYEPNLQSKYVEMKYNVQSISPDEGYDGISDLQVVAFDISEGKAVIGAGQTLLGVEGIWEGTALNPTVKMADLKDAEWDEIGRLQILPNAGTGERYATAFLLNPADGGLKPNNLRKGVKILGVEGTYEETFNTQSKSIKPEAFPSEVTPDSGYDGLSSVTVEAPTNLEAGNIKKDVTIAGVVGTYKPNLVTTQTTASSFPVVLSAEGKEWDGFTEVTIWAPKNLEAENIKKGVTIAEVEGTYEPTLQSKTTQATSFPTVVDVDEGYDGMTEVTITAPDNLEAGNIKKGIEIAGVAGTYEPNIVVGSTKATSFPTVVSVEGKGWDGYSEVTVYAPDNLEAGNIKKGVSIAEVVGTYEPTLQTKETQAVAFPTVVDVDSGYDGMTEVTVTAPDNLTAENIKKDVIIAGVTGIYSPQPTLQSKDITPSTFPTAITADDGYDGLSSVNIQTPKNLEADNIRKNITIAGVTGTFGPTETITWKATRFPALLLPTTAGGLKSVTVTAPDNLEAGNIKKGVTIAEVEGTYEPTLQTTYAVPTAFPTTYTPTSGFDGIASIEIRVPKNLEAENIKKDVTIAGITGTYEVSGSNSMGLYLTNKPFELTEDSWDGVTGTVTRALSSTNITSAVIGEGITTLAGYMFSGCKSLTTVQLPSTLTALPDGCFQNSTLTSVNIPSGIANISASCFYNCSNLTEIDIPASVSILYSYAFNNCTGLKTITVRTQTPPTVQSLALTGLSSLTTIYVPSGRGNVYKAASGWSNYSAKIVEGNF